MPPADNGWTAAQVKQLIEQVMNERDVRYGQRFDWERAHNAALRATDREAIEKALNAAQTAVDKSERAQELRNQVSNEFRQTLADQANTFWTIKEGQAALKSVEDKLIAAVDNGRRERENSMADLRAQVGLLGNKVQPLDTIVQSIATMESEVGKLRGSSELNAGRHLGSSAVIASLFATAGLLIAIVAVIVSLTR